MANLTLAEITELVRGAAFKILNVGLGKPDFAIFDTSIKPLIESGVFNSQVDELESGQIAQSPLLVVEWFGSQLIKAVQNEDIDRLETLLMIFDVFVPQK